MSFMARASKASFQALIEVDDPTASSNTDSQGHKTVPSRAPAGPSRIGAGASFIGRVESTGEIQIEGSVEGDIKGQAVRLGGEAKVKGKIVGEIAQLSGAVEGNIEAQTVILTKSARIVGEITYRSLQIEAGAFIEGSCRPLQTGPSA